MESRVRPLGQSLLAHPKHAPGAFDEVPGAWCLCPTSFSDVGYVMNLLLDEAGARGVGTPQRVGALPLHLEVA
jgi:hypothetical protein